MQALHFPYVHLPPELVSLLKMNLSGMNFSEEIFSRILQNRPLAMLIESTFPEFFDSKKIDKMIVAVGWNGFRDRLTSLYVIKAQTGSFPKAVETLSVGDISDFHERLVHFGVSGYSRAYLLGLYLKLANISQQKLTGKRSQLVIPADIDVFLRLSQKRSEKIDFLIIILCHLYYGLGDKLLLNSLASGKSFDVLYDLLNPDYKKQMSDNLLAYSASIGEPDIFLYGKV